MKLFYKGSFHSNMLPNVSILCLKKLQVKTIIDFTKIFFSHKVRFVLDLIDQYYSLFTVKFN